MALPSSGAISLNNVNQQLGRASPYNQTITMNDADVRALFGVGDSPAQISMSDGYGKTSVVTFSGGGSYSWTIPAGITSIFVKAWGGGGGGGGPDGDGYGGAGGYFEGTISGLYPGYTIDISVPGVATGDVDYQCACDENGFVTNIPNNSGDGGGATVVAWQTTNTYCIVGGGGGGANGDGGPGGSDGESEGGAGGGGGSSPYGGGNGGAASGGAGYCSGSVHSYITPGSGCNNWNKGLAISCGGDSGYGGGGGRGGDGWAGGGTGFGQAATGLCDAYPNGGGGGGGSTGWTGTGWSNTVSIRNTDVSYSGSRRVAPEMANVDYPGESTPLVAYGADFGAFGGDGGPGYVVIRY